MYFKSVKLSKTIYTTFLIQTTFYHVYYYDIPPKIVILKSMIVLFLCMFDLFYSSNTSPIKREYFI